MEEEIPLTGGRVTPGVFRSGDTVRRPLSKNSRFVHELLRHLESAQFPHSPRYLGIDSRGREILSFVDGWVPPNIGEYSLAQLREAGRLISRLHEATAGSALAGDQEVVCHHDLSPCNFVFRSTVPTHIIDFDAAAPGPRRLDVGYAAWMWLDLGNSPLAAPELGKRLATFLSGYGSKAPVDPLDAILEAQEWLTERARGPNQDPSYAAEVLVWARRCQVWVRRNQVGLEAGLRAASD